jgi:hypothetical protein
MRKPTLSPWLMPIVSLASSSRHAAACVGSSGSGSMLIVAIAADGLTLDHTVPPMRREELFRVVSETAARGNAAASQPLAVATRTLAHRMKVEAGPLRVTLVLAGSAWQARGAPLLTLSRRLFVAICQPLCCTGIEFASQGAASLAMRYIGLDYGPEIFTRLPK